MDKAYVEMVGRYCFRVKIGDHELYMDLSKPKGGEDKGPNPPSYLLASIAGCIGIVSKLLAEQEGVKIEKMEIEVTGDHDTRGIFMPEKYDSRIRDIRVKVKVKGEPIEKVKEIIERAKEVCPVCRTIKEKGEISLEILE